MAKKLKETYRHTDIQTYIHTYRLPLVVLSAALQQKTSTETRKSFIQRKLTVHPIVFKSGRIDYI